MNAAFVKNHDLIRTKIVMLTMFFCIRYDVQIKCPSSTACDNHLVCRKGSRLCILMNEFGNRTRGLFVTRVHVR